MVYSVEQSVFIAEYYGTTCSFKDHNNAVTEKFPNNKVSTNSIIQYSTVHHVSVSGQVITTKQNYPKKLWEELHNAIMKV
jgi:hypothetical protein